MSDPALPRDSRVRSLVKGCTWRVVATLTTIAIAWAITRDTRIALEIGAIEVVAKIGVYYVHERVWQSLPLGRARITAAPGIEPADVRDPRPRDGEQDRTRRRTGQVAQSVGAQSVGTRSVDAQGIGAQKG